VCGASVALARDTGWEIGQRLPASNRQRCSCAHVHVHMLLCMRVYRYELEGVRRTVDAVLLVGEHNHPYVLLLQVW
jgi:hypothetical protein